MKHVIFFLLLFVGCELSAQSDSLTYDQFKIEFLEYQPPTTWNQIHADPVFIPSVILAGAFVTQVMVTNDVITMGNVGKVSPTTIIFLTGGIVAATVYFLRL